MIHCELIITELLVVDALGKLPSGLLEGDLLWFGSLDQCRDIVGDKHIIDGNTVQFEGKFCMATTFMPVRFHFMLY